jgi:plasmid stabilization system protein ParE
VIYNIAYRPAVKWDITDAVDYYRVINPKLAKQFLFRIREATNHILRNPLAFQVKYKNVRTLLLKQFPYYIHYLVNDNKQVIILAVIHAYRNPTDYSIR